MRQFGGNLKYSVKYVELLMMEVSGPTSVHLYSRSQMQTLGQINVVMTRKERNQPCVCLSAVGTFS